MLGLLTTVVVADACRLRGVRLPLRITVGLAMKEDEVNTCACTGSVAFLSVSGFVAVADAVTGSVTIF